jgi:hypothetical protein
MTPAAPGARPGEQALSVEGLTLYADVKAATDLDGASLELAESSDDIVVIHEHGVVGGFC